MAPVLLLAALVSGSAALAAEVVWFRALGRGVGTSAEALAVVSAAFLGGLGIGAAIAARRAPRSRRPLRAAALCEAVAGVLVCLSPAAVAWVPEAHRALLDALGLSPGRSAWPAALVAVPILLVPAAFLGATMPFLVRSRLRRDDGTVRGAAGWTGAIYAVNTLGAALGAVAAAWVLLPGAGEAASLRFAGCGNLAAAMLLLLVDRPSAAASAATLPDAPPPAPDIAAAAASEVPLAASAIPPPIAAPAVAASAVSSRLPAFALFASGAVALGGEVAWLRLLEPVVGVHLYGFVLLLVSVLLGTAVGGAVGGALAERVRRPDLWLAGTLGLGGALTVASVWVAGHVPTWTLEAATAAKDWDWSQSRTSLAVRVLGSAFAVWPPLAVFATAYPLAVRARAANVERATAAVGSVYAWNTAGNVVGSLAAGFVLLPALGGPMTLAAVGGVGCLAAAGLWLASARRPVLVGAAFLVVPALLAMPGASRVVARAGPSLREVVALGRWSDAYRIRSRADLATYCDMAVGTYPRPAFRPTEPPIEPIEGVVGSVGILDEKDIRLRQGGLSESRFNRADPNAGSETEVSLALVPYLFRPGAKRALVIGHGAGWTCETLLAADETEQVDVAEIETAVLKEVERYRGTLEVRTNPKAHLRIADGRLLLREAAARGGTYDVVASQPSHPWVPGAGHLFTKEAYALARRALTKGGVFAQWLNVFDMNRDLFHAALAAFHDAFPEGWVFVHSDELVLVGFTEPAQVDWGRWERAFAADGVGLKAKAAGIRGPEDVLKRFALDGDSTARLIPAGTAPASDDDPSLELGLALRRFLTPDDRTPEMDAVKAEVRDAFAPHLDRWIPDARARERAATGVLLRLAEDGRPTEARAWDRAVRVPAGPDANRARALLELAAAKASGTDPTTRRAHVARALELYAAAAAAAPKDARDVVARLDLLLDENRAPEAVAEGRAAAQRFPDDGRVWSSLANALIASEMPEAADEAFTKAEAARSPRAPAGTGLRHARMLRYLSRPRPADAVKALEADATTWDDRAALRELLTLLLERSGDDPSGAATARGAEVDARLTELDRAHAAERLTAARRGAGDKADDGLAAAQAAAEADPESIEARRWLGWFSLRKDDLEGAARAFQAVLEKTKDPAGERRRIEGYYRILRRDPATLDAPLP